MSSAYQIYRSTTIGLALDDTLHELVDSQMLTSPIAHYILSVFDEIINQKLAFQSIKGKKEPCLLFKGHLRSYRACDQVWTLLFDSIAFTSNTNLSWNINLSNQKDKIKFITCPASKCVLSNTEQRTTKDQDNTDNNSKNCKKFKST